MTKRMKAILFIVIVGFMAVAVLVTSGLSLPIESFIYSKIQPLITPTNTIIATIFTYFSEPITIIIFSLIIISLPYTRRKLALPVSACAAGGAGLAWGLKQVFLRDRPNILRLVAETGHSFPSGHSATSAALGTIFLLLLAHFHVRQPKKSILTALCFVLPFLVGLSRIYLGVHYAGDVLAGWLLGIFVGIIVYWLWSAAIKRKQEA